MNTWQIRMRRWAVAALFVCLSAAAPAATLMGRVVAISDGDTVLVRDARGNTHKVRLAGIDAPELGQAFGNPARRNLWKHVYRREVTVEWYKTGPYTDMVGIVRVGEVDVNLEQLRAGMAWWYRHYADEQSREDRALYEQAEDRARFSRRGLWVDARPTPPWDWRKRR